MAGLPEEDDVDLKDLRAAVLSSMRSKDVGAIPKGARIEADIDDLDELRSAALKSFKTGETFVASGWRPNRNSYSSRGGSKLPKWYTAPKSNLIVLQAHASDDAANQDEIAKRMRTGAKLILPQDRYHVPNAGSPQPSPDGKRKKFDKFSRFDARSSDEEEEESEHSSAEDSDNVSSYSDSDRSALSPEVTTVANEMAPCEVADEVIEFKDDVDVEPQIAAVDYDNRRETIEFDLDEDFNFDIIDSADIEEERSQSAAAAAADPIQTSATENFGAKPRKSSVTPTTEKSAEKDDEQPTGNILEKRRLIEAELASINRRLGYFGRTSAGSSKEKTKTSPTNSGCGSETERVSLTENQSNAELRDENESLSSKSSSSSSSSSNDDGREWRYRSRAQPQTSVEKANPRAYITPAILPVSSDRRRSGRRRSRSRSRRRHRSPLVNRKKERSRSRHRHEQPRSRSKGRSSARRSGRSRSRSPRRRRSRPSSPMQKRKDEEKPYSKSKRVTGSNAVPLGARVGLASAVVLSVPEQAPPSRKFIGSDKNFEAQKIRRHSGPSHGKKPVATKEARSKVINRDDSQKPSLAVAEPVTLKSLPLPSNSPRLIRIKPKKHQRPATVDQPNDFLQSDLLKITIDSESGAAPVEVVQRKLPVHQRLGPIKKKVQQRKSATVLDQPQQMQETAIVSPKPAPVTSRIVQLNKPELPQEAISVKWAVNGAKKIIGTDAVLNDSCALTTAAVVADGAAKKVRLKRPT